jgi:hypothetical protein
MKLERALEIIQEDTGGKTDPDDIRWSNLHGTRIEVVDEEGDNEGDGTYTQVVFKVTDGDDSALLGYTGYYDSWNGTQWDLTPNLVEAYEVVVVKYRII